MGPQDLLIGPRGRRLCWALLCSTDSGVDLSDTARAVRHWRDRFAAGGAAARDVLIVGLRDSVDVARYWQDPDEDDIMLASPEAGVMLAPVAEAVAASDESAWWSTGVELDKQMTERATRAVGAVAEPATTDDALRRWRSETLAGNERMRQQRIVGGEQRWSMTSGIWWTPPHRWEITVSTRLLDPLGPVGLWLAEDRGGEEALRFSLVSGPAEPRVYEVTGPSAWAELVARYPLDVTFARGANWRQATGRDGAWLIPDWHAVAGDYEAVHLTVQGYLTTSGKIVPVGEHTATFIAGWNPDETLWLTDVAVAPDTTEWTLDDHTDMWVESGCR